MGEPQVVIPTVDIPHVVILGAGFAGLTTARALAKAPCRLTLVDRRNYHLFQPLLYQVATAALSPADIATPIRSILRHQRNATVLMGRVDGVDRVRREVSIDGRRLGYDILVIATGARHAYFGHDAWEATAPGLKKIDDATEIRRRLLLAFEQAEVETDAAQRAALLTFAVIGGGPTGVEMAGAIAELARQTLIADFRAIDPAQARILLIEAGPRLLAAFAPDLSVAAQEALERLGVELRLNQAVTACENGFIRIGNNAAPASAEEIATQTVIWAAGVMASPAARWLGAAQDKAGRVLVSADLRLPDAPEIFVIGDTAAVTGPDGRPVPGLAPAAKQMGAYVAQVITAQLADRHKPAPFRYRHLGSLATIGRAAAVADFGRLKLRGRLAWLLWGLIHVFFLIGIRSRLLVALQWLWAYITYQRGARLITSPGRTME